MSSDPPSSPAPAARPLLLPVCLVAGLSLLAYLPVLGGEFLEWDDRAVIATNPRLVAPTTDGLAHYWTELHPHREFYAPLNYTVWWLVAHVAGRYSPAQDAAVLRAWPFHAVNWLAHAGSAAVVLLILHRLVRRRWAACAGAMLFALHPVQAEAVAWASTMYTPLSGLLSLLAVWQYLRFADLRPGRAAWAAFGVATLAFAAALLTKPTAVVVPLVVAAIELLVRGRRVRELVPLAAWLATSVPVVLLARTSQHGAPVYVPPMPSRVLVALDALAFYLEKLVLPLRFAADYGRSPHWLLNESGQAYSTWVVPVFLTVIAWAVRPKAPWLLGCVVLFVAALLPTLGLVPFDYQRYSTVADRYLYLAMLAPALALAWVLSLRPRRLLLVTAVVATLVLGAVASAQTRHWRDTEALFSHALAVNSRSLAAHAYFGYQYAQAGRPDDALAEYDKALRANPGDPVVLSLVADVYTRQRRLPEAIAAYRQALGRMPDNAPLHVNLGVALAQTGQVEEGARLLRRAVELDPQNAEAHANLATALSASQDWAGARAHYEQALRLDPNSATARRGMARIEASGH
jgi:tetratricopeptide (TPR) repeat protein